MPDSPPKLLNSVLARAMAHPTRVRAIAVLIEREATPAAIAAELGEPLSNVSYHVEVLEELGCIELVEERPSHGGRVVQHVYRAVDRAYVDLEEWDRFGEKEKLTLTVTLMRLISEDISNAMVSGTFFDPDDNHLSRTPLKVDRAGWAETQDVLKAALENLFEIEARSAERMAKSGEEAVPTKVEIVHFRSPAMQ